MVNFINSDVSGMNFAKFMLKEKNFANNKMCDAMLPWNNERIIVNVNLKLYSFLITLMIFLSYSNQFNKAII